MITFALSAAPAGSVSADRGNRRGRRETLARMRRVSWVFVGLLAGAVVVLLAAEWPRVTERLGVDARLEERQRRSRARRKARLRVVPDESEDFEASVRRDLERLPTIEKPDRRR